MVAPSRMPQFEPGDHLWKSGGRAGGVLYDHHVIFMGAADTDAGTSIIIENSFRAGKVVKKALTAHQMRPYSLYERPQDPDLCMQRAQSALGRRYNLVTFNCETFANECVHGAGKSRQVVRAVGHVSLGASTVGTSVFASSVGLTSTATVVASAPTPGCCGLWAALGYTVTTVSTITVANPIGWAAASGAGCLSCLWCCYAACLKDPRKKGAKSRRELEKGPPREAASKSAPSQAGAADEDLTTGGDSEDEVAKSGKEGVLDLDSSCSSSEWAQVDIEENPSQPEPETQWASQAEPEVCCHSHAEQEPIWPFKSEPKLPNDCQAEQESFCTSQAEPENICPSGTESLRASQAEPTSSSDCQIEPELPCATQAKPEHLCASQAGQEPFRDSQAKPEPSSAFQAEPEPSSPSQTEREPSSTSHAKADSSCVPHTETQPSHTSEAVPQPLSDSLAEAEHPIASKVQPHPPSTRLTEPEPCSDSHIEPEPSCSFQAEPEPLHDSQGKPEPCCIQAQPEPLHALQPEPPLASLQPFIASMDEPEPSRASQDKPETSSAPQAKPEPFCGTSTCNPTRHDE